MTFHQLSALRFDCSLWIKTGLETSRKYDNIISYLTLLAPPYLHLSLPLPLYYHPSLPNALLLFAIITSLFIHFIKIRLFMAEHRSTVTPLLVRYSPLPYERWTAPLGSSSPPAAEQQCGLFYVPFTNTDEVDKTNGLTSPPNWPMLSP